MKGNQMSKVQVGLLGCCVVVAWSAVARGQAWISFVEDPSRISAADSVINDINCGCAGACDPGAGADFCTNSRLAWTANRSSSRNPRGSFTEPGHHPNGLFKK